MMKTPDDFSGTVRRGNTAKPDPRPEPILLHVCCATCAAACVERLKTEKRRVVLYYSNSNIGTADEFDKRLADVRSLAEEQNLELLVDPYDHAAWLAQLQKSLPDFAAFPEGGARCRLCFAWSLGRTAAEAERRTMHFCTTLTVSPHKNSAVIFGLAANWSHFEPYNFKKKDGFKRSVILSKEHGFYRQRFCGCEFSRRD